MTYIGTPCEYCGDMKVKYYYDKVGNVVYQCDTCLEKQ